MYLENHREGFLHFEASKRLAKRFTSSGSTGGRPKVTYYTFDDWAACVGHTIRQNIGIPRSWNSPLFIAFHAGTHAGKNTEEVFSRFGCLVEMRHYTRNTAEAVIEQLANGFRDLGGFRAMSLPPCAPPGLQGSKGVTLTDLLDADIDNYIGKNIRLIMTGGAPSLPELRIAERLQEATDLAGAPPIRFIEKYGASEIGVGASTCTAGGMHIQDGLTYTEVISEKTGQPALHGEKGLVVQTSLRHGSRYLRYVVGDEATLHTDRCSCGKTTARLTGITRVLDKERLNSGCAAGAF
jgi:phenylacetate-coenzyme A ligase PaaK-like adenylate-forming protein